MMKVEGAGTIRFKIKRAQTKKLNQVQYVPNLAHNLLSIGQLLNGGYTIVFDDKECAIRHKKSATELARVHISEHNLFPLTINEVGATHVAAN